MYKTIVVHIDGSRQQESRLRAAALLAGAHGAHLVGAAATGVSWLDLALLSGAASAPVPVADFDELRETATARLRQFEEQAARLGVGSVESRLIEDAAGSGLLLESRYADLMVLSQDPRPAPGLPLRARGMPEHLAIRGTRPVLVVPEDYRVQVLPGIVVAGWDGSLQALRAITAALPLLAAADSVKLVLVNPDARSALHGEQPGADLALYLARHGVRVEVVLERTGSTVGNALMALARDSGAALMVAGVYGHSRYRELALGGVTRELLERAPVPLLIAH